LPCALAFERLQLKQGIPATRILLAFLQLAGDHLLIEAIDPRLAVFPWDFQWFQ
jgi:hypothetical protein